MRTISASEKLVNREALDAAELFLKRLDGGYPVRGGILFGSRARASHNADSDADLAVVLAGTSGDRRSASRDMAGIAFDVLMETGVLVDPLPLWEDELERRAGSRSGTRRSSTRSGVMECVCERYARRSLVLHAEG